MKNAADIVWTLLAIAMLATMIWGVGWCLDEEERQVKAGVKHPSSTILPIVDHEHTQPAQTPQAQ